jgi:hypothetical protein
MVWEQHAVVKVTPKRHLYALQQSATLMTMPSASTTVVQMRSLSTASLNDNSGPLPAVWPQQ